MYNPYKQRGEWLDCNICGSSHRKILDADLTEYNSPVLTDIEREQCYTCTPIILDYSKFCKNCNTDNLYKVSYSSKLPTKCLHCGFDTAEEKYIPMGIYEKRPTLKGEGRELLNRIKKRNYGSTMPDY